MPKCNFNKIAKHVCSPVNLLCIFRIPFPKNTSGRLPLFAGKHMDRDLILIKLHTHNLEKVIICKDHQNKIVEKKIIRRLIRELRGKNTTLS